MLAARAAHRSPGRRRRRSRSDPCSSRPAGPSRAAAVRSGSSRRARRCDHRGARGEHGPAGQWRADVSAWLAPRMRWLSSRAMAAWYIASTVAFQRNRRLRRSSPKDHNTMARVPYLQQSDLPPEHQDILARPIALNRAMANSPNAAQGDDRARDVHPPSAASSIRGCASSPFSRSAISRSRPTNTPITSSSAARPASPTTTSAPSTRRPPAGRPSSTRCRRPCCAPRAR